MTGAVIPAGRENPELAAIERERFYDTEIAPALADLGRRCQEKGLSFLAVVEWAVGEVGKTAALQADRGPQIDWAYVAATAAGNADSLILHIMRQAHKSGHSSVCLNLLGVSPTAKADL
jgi:hypothetical protein